MDMQRDADRAREYDVPATDTGVDRVAGLRDEPGCFAAVQCRVLETGGNIPKKQVGSFLAASAHSEFRRRVRTRPASNHRPAWRRAAPAPTGTGGSIRRQCRPGRAGSRDRVGPSRRAPCPKSSAMLRTSFRGSFGIGTRRGSQAPHPRDGVYGDMPFGRMRRSCPGQKIRQDASTVHGQPSSAGVRSGVPPFPRRGLRAVRSQCLQRSVRDLLPAAFAAPRRGPGRRCRRP